MTFRKMLMGALSVAILAITPLSTKANVVSNNNSATQAGNYARQLIPLFYLFASGNQPIQEQETAMGHLIGASDNDLNVLSADVRAAYLKILSVDTAMTGIYSADRNDPVAGQQVVDDLNTQIQDLFGPKYPAFEAWVSQWYPILSSTSWVSKHIGPMRTIVNGRDPYLVWATGYSQTSFPANWSNGNTYAAVPDTYVKWANWAWYGSPDWSIPSQYQSYYAYAPYAVSIATSTSGPWYNVVVSDVGPWNEDDNWWDSTNSTPINGLYPSNGTNWRRIYYYLLYKQNGTYSPTGTFTSSNPPTAISTGVSEAAAGYDYSYNGDYGGWTRENSYNHMTNQASIDLGPGAQADLGWTFPSSGWVQTDTGDLP